MQDAQDLSHHSDKAFLQQGIYFIVGQTGISIGILVSGSLNPPVHIVMVGRSTGIVIVVSVTGYITFALFCNAGSLINIFPNPVGSRLVIQHTGGIVANR